jgi:hypothetical protein
LGKSRKLVQDEPTGFHHVRVNTEFLNVIFLVRGEYANSPLASNCPPALICEAIRVSAIYPQSNQKIWAD